MSAKTIKWDRSGPGAGMLCLAVVVSGFGAGAAPSRAWAIAAQDPPAAPENAPKGKRPRTGRPVKPGATPGGEAEAQNTPPAAGEEKDPSAADPNAAQKAQDAAAQRQARIDAARKAMEARRAAANPNAPEGNPPAAPPATPEPVPQPVEQPPVLQAEPPSGPANHVEIAPVDNNAKPEDRTYSFSFKDASYDQIVEAFARQTGLGVLGDIPADGKVSFVAMGALSFPEALSRMRLLLFNYKPTEPYWIDRTGSHLRVSRVVDLVRNLPLDRWFKSIDDLWAANLADDELVLVIYTPQSGTPADLRQARDFLPDYVRMTPLEDGNSVSIFALVKDIKKFLDILNMFGTGPKDPRPIVKLEVKYITPSDAVTKLEALMNQNPNAAVRGTPQPQRRSGAQGPNPLDMMQDPMQTIIPDDLQGVLIVRAMQDRIDEIKKLLAVIDVELPVEAHPTVVIPVERAKAAVLIETLQQILAVNVASAAAEAAGAQPGAAPPPRRSRRSARTTAAPLGADGISLLPHPSQNAIIALGDEAAVLRVRELVKQFDVEGEVGPVRLALKRAAAADAAASILSALGEGPKRPEGTGINLFADPAGDALWFTGSEYDFKKVQVLVGIIDVDLVGSTLHMARLLRQKPSFVASLLTEYDRDPGSAPAGAAAPAPAKPAGRRNPAGAAGAVSKFTPNDEQGLLYVLCHEAEWTAYKTIIDQLEEAAEVSESFVRVPVKHIDPQSAIDQLSGVIGAAGDPRAAAVKYVPADGAFLVIGAKPTEINDLKAILEQIDVPLPIEQRAFTIRHRPTADIKSAIETLIAGDPNAQPPARRPRPEKPGASGSVLPSLTMFEIGDQLIVKAPPSMMEQIARLITELDVQATGTVVRVYSDFPPGSDLDALAENLAGAIADPATPAAPAPQRPGARGGVRATSPEGPKFIPQSAAGKLIVITPPAMIPKIEEMLAILRPIPADVVQWAREFIPLKYAEPEEIVELVTPMLEIQAKKFIEEGEIKETPEQSAPAAPGPRRPGQPGGTSEHFHIAADVRNRWVVLAAPEAVIADARGLIAKLDQPSGGTEAVFRTVDLKNADPAEMVKAIKEMMGAGGGRIVRRAAPTKGAAAPAEPFDPDTFSVVEAPGGRSVILHGPKDVVEQTVEWIEQLDAQATRGRVVKTYTIHHADIKTLAELLLNVVDKPTVRGGPNVRRAPKLARSAGPGFEEEEAELETTKDWIGEEMYIHADLIGGTMVVAAPKAMIAEVDAIVAKFDPEDPEESTAIAAPLMPQHEYELQNRTDVLTAANDLEMLLDGVWQPNDELPKVSASAFGNILIIRYTHPERFAEVDKWISEKIDRRSEADEKVIRRFVPVPEGLTARQAAQRFIELNPDLDAEMRDETAPTPDFGIEKVGPRATPGKDGNRCVLPGAFARVADDIVRSAGLFPDPPPEEKPAENPPADNPPPPDELAEEAQPPQEQQEPQPQPVQPQPIVLPPTSADVLRDASLQLLQNKKKDEPEDGKPKRSTAAKVPPGTKMKISYDEVNQVFTIEGPAGALTDLDDRVDELKKDAGERFVPPNIQVYRVRYLDVYTAADILEEMFNATRQQRQMAEAQNVQQQQLRQQQMAIQQQQQRLLQQQQAQQQGKGQPGQPQRPDQQQQQPQQQLGMQQLPPTAVRIYPNPRDKTLILRADASQYPAILELLATIDQPQPLNAEIRTYKLDKLNALEVEEMLRDMLGLDRRAASAASAGRTSARRRGPGEVAGPVGVAGAGGGGAQLPETLVQEVQSGTGVLGIDPDDIKLSSNEQANALIALAPIKALDYIGDLIKKLESEDIPDRITKYYELKNADAGDVADYLEAQFLEHAPGAAGGKGARPAGPEGRSLNTPSFIPFPPRNLITVLATPTQIEEIDGVIARLDVKDDDEWQNVTLGHADAQAVADTLTQMYGSGAAPARGQRGNAPAAAPSGPGAKFIADDSGRVVFYTAPEGLRQAILDTIAKLEAEAGDTTKIRVIALKYAKASDVATAIDEAYGRSRRAGPPGKAPAATQLSVTAHDPSGKLFVRADDKTFAEVESLVSLLDQENSTGVEFRIYPLRYANARAVHTVMSSLMRDYIGRLGPRGQGGLEAFSVEVDDRANALIVLGTPSVFGFVEENLRKIDTPASKAGAPGFLMVALKNADATEIAGNITRLWAQRGPAGSTEQPPQAEANRALNTIIVRGTQAQLDEIKKEMIDPLELQAAKTLATQTITLKYADPDAVAESINRVFEDKKRAMQNIRSQGGSPLDFTVVVTPDAITKQIVVQASEDNLALVKARVAELDREDIAKAGSISVRIYSMKYADPNAVATIISAWGRTKTQGPGRSGTPAAADSVSAVAEPATGSVVVTASEANHLIIAGLIAGLDGETGAIRQRQREVLKLQFASARDVADQLGQVFRAGGSRRGGDTGPTFVASPDTNSIVASVYEDELGEVKKLLAEIDVVGEVATDRTTEMYALTFAEPGALIPIVDGMFRGERGPAARASDQVTAVPEAGTKSLVITASPRNHALVKALIAKLDVESRFMREYHTVTLQKGDAQLVTRALQDLLRGQRGSPTGEQPPQIAADLSTNSLLIFASEAEMADIDKLVKMMDIEPDLSRGRQVKSVHLVNADPGAVQEAISKLFGADKGDAAGAVTAVAEWGSNSVIVSASPAGMTRVDELIKQIDGAADKQHGVHVVTLANADADAVSRTLQDIFVRTAQRGGAAGQQPITISALQGSKALLVRARDDDFAKIEATVAELDREDAVIGGEVRVITLLYSDVTEMQTALEKYLSKPGRAGGGGKGAGELVGDVRISALAQGNSLVISGAKEEVERLEATIKQLDESGEKGSKPQVISLKYAFAADLAPNLTEMFAKASGGGRGKAAPVIFANEQTNQLIIRASATDLNAIEALVAELDKEDSAGENFRLVQVASGVNVTDVAEKVERTLNDSAAAKQSQGQGRGRQQNITVTPDTRSNTLILAGSPSMFDDAEKLVRGMEKLGPAGGASMKIITLGNVPANEIQQLIDRLKGDESSSGSSRGRARPASRPRPTPAPARPRP